VIGQTVVMRAIVEVATMVEWSGHRAISGAQLVTVTIWVVYTVEVEKISKVSTKTIKLLSRRCPSGRVHVLADSL
jgi:hypothetical protein